MSNSNKSLASLFFNQNKKFFFLNRDKTAEYASTFCPDEKALVMRTADDVVEQRFAFNLRWDMERTHEPVVFSGPIDWLRQPGDDPEWIFAFNRMRFWICLGQAYAFTKDEKYASCFASQLTSWIKSVPRSDPNNAKAWRTIETGLRLEYWLKAICYFEGSNAITDDVMKIFIESITDHAEFLMSVYNSFNYMSNWGVLANHGLFLAGAMLPDWDEVSKKRHKEYLDTSLERLSQITSVQIYDDGLEWEQSPMYHNEVLHDLLDVVIIANRNGIPLPSPISQKTHAMCRADVILQKPNGNEISMGDSDEIDQRDIVTKGAIVFNDALLKSFGYDKFDFDTVWDLGADAAEEYSKMNSVLPEKLTNALSSSGNIVFRSNWNKDSTFLHFHCGTLGAGHGHSDTLHIDLFDNGEDILIDSGRFTYVDKPERYEFKDSNAHNTCTVDNENFYKCVDSWGCSKLNKTVNLKWNDKEKYAYCEGGHLSYILNPTTESNGVYANRRIVYIKPDIFVIADTFYGKGRHTYQQYYHFNNYGKLIDCCKGNTRQFRYQGKETAADFVLIPSTGTTEDRFSSVIMNGRISRHYNIAENTQVLKNELKGENFTSLYTVIFLDHSKKDEINKTSSTTADTSLKNVDATTIVNSSSKACDVSSVVVRKVPVLSNFKNSIFPDNMIEALEIEKDGKAYTVVFANQEYASPTDTFSAGGITYKELEKLNIPMWQSGNHNNNGTADSWGAVNWKESCSGFGQVVVFDRSHNSPDKCREGGFRTGTILAV